MRDNEAFFSAVNKETGEIIYIDDMYWFEENFVNSLTDDLVFLFERPTGLLDKNGKAIYENDVCRIYYHDGAREDMRVDWDAEKAQFRFLDAYGDGWTITQTPIEVIGTIHDAEYKELAK